MLPDVVAEVFGNCRAFTETPQIRRGFARDLVSEREKVQAVTEIVIDVGRAGQRCGASCETRAETGV